LHRDLQHPIGDLGGNVLDLDAGGKLDRPRERTVAAFALFDGGANCECGLVAVAAFNDAFGRLAKDMIAWTVQAL